MVGLFSSNFERMAEALASLNREAATAEQKLQAEVAQLEKEKADFAAYRNEEQAKLDADRKKFHEECRFMYKQYGVGESDEAASQAAAEQVSTFPMPVKINVGGKTFQTTMMTLQGKHAGEQDSMLAAMFSGRHPNCLDEGIVFIDRDGDQFAHLMEYLRSPTGKMGYFQNLRNKHLQALREAKRDLEYEQMLEEARYFQLQGVLALLLPPTAWFGRDSTYGVLQAPEIPAAGDVITWKWEHHAGLSNAELYALEEDGTIRFVRAGTFLIMAKVPGVSANNSGCGQLVLDGTVTDECWSGDQHGDNNMLYFNRVMAIAPGGRLHAGQEPVPRFQSGKCEGKLTLHCSSAAFIECKYAIRLPANADY